MMTKVLSQTFLGLPPQFIPEGFRRSMLRYTSPVEKSLGLFA